MILYRIKWILYIKYKIYLGSYDGGVLKRANSDEMIVSNNKFI